jgi:ABC-type lipoprotein export system ATPase subunit
MTIVMVTHSHECAQFAEKSLLISDGLLVGKEGWDYEEDISFIFDKKRGVGIFGSGLL